VSVRFGGVAAPLGPRFRGGPLGPGGGGGLRLVATVPVAVTWNAGQDVLVYVREQPV
jgi:hypothetical protein